MSEIFTIYCCASDQYAEIFEDRLRNGNEYTNEDYEYKIVRNYRLESKNWISLEFEWNEKYLSSHIKYHVLYFFQDIFGKSTADHISFRHVFCVKGKNPLGNTDCVSAVFKISGNTFVHQAANYFYIYFYSPEFEVEKIENITRLIKNDHITEYFDGKINIYFGNVIEKFREMKDIFHYSQEYLYDGIISHIYAGNKGICDIKYNNSQKNIYQSEKFLGKISEECQKKISKIFPNFLFDPQEIIGKYIESIRLVEFYSRKAQF